MSQLLSVENLKISCGGRPIVRDVNFSVTKGTVTAIVGPSGAGKTTLLRSLNRLLEEDGGFKVDGSLLFNETHLYGDLSKYDLRRKIGLVFQKPTIFPTSIYKNVIFGVRHTAPRPKRDYPSLVESCLQRAFLWEEVKERLHESALKLSIGQQQRLAIARSLAIEPEILLMDEPTSSLDPRAAAQIEKLIVSLKSTATVVLVTHSQRQAREISDQVVLLRPSTEGSTAEVIADREELGKGGWYDEM